MIEDTIKASRSFRRFHQDRPIALETLKELVNLGRLSPSAANLQPLKYILSSDPQMNERIFTTLAWAAYLRPWLGPAEGERPAAYIVILGDTQISKNFGCDHGIAAQSIMLGAAEKGIGGCMIGSIDRPKLREILNLPDRYEILLVLALGYPKEKVVLEEAGPNGNVKYYRDADGVHHVPKRPLNEIILRTFAKE